MGFNFSVDHFLLLLLLLFQCELELFMLERFNHAAFDHLLPDVGRVEHERHVEHLALEQQAGGGLDLGYMR